MLKKLAREEREASRPCDVVFGQVVSVSPLAVQLEQKLTLSEPFLMLTSQAASAGLTRGTKVVLLRKSGGQQYVVLDRIGVAP